MTAPSDAIKDRVAIILVPGSFTPPHLYHKTTSLLHNHGFQHVRECQLLSACPLLAQRHPPATLADDALYIREAVSAYLERRKDVVIVVNSYGGFPTTQALAGLPSRGHVDVEATEGAVVGVVFLASFLPQPGDSIRTVMGDLLFEPLKSGTKGEYMVLAPEAGPGVINDMHAEGKGEEADWYWKQMVTHSSDSFDGKVEHDLWKGGEGGFEGKVVFIAGGMDALVPGKLVDEMIGRVEGRGGVEIRRVDVEKGGHMMHVSKPDVVVRTVEEVLAG